MGTRRASIALLMALALGGCQTEINPATGRREVVLMSEGQERQVGAEMAQQVEAEYGLASDPRLEAYVDSVGRPLAEQSPRQDVVYSFHVVEMDEPNAFALPGGSIYVSRGLLVVANSEAELANVLGHEIGHVAARHAALRDAHLRTLGLATLLSDILSGSSEDMGDSERVSGDFIARYSRNQERQADRIGQDLAAAAGVDPAGMATFLRTLDAVTKLKGGSSQVQTYLSDHPATPERVAEATTSAQERAWRSGGDGADPEKEAFATARSRDAYLAHIDGMSVGRPASEGVFIGERFLHPVLNFSLRFPLDWQYDNQSAQVVGLSPLHDAVVLLQLQGPGTDPEDAARTYAAHEGLPLQDAQKLLVGALPAFRARALVPTSFGRVAAEITWIAYEGRIYRLVAGMEPGSFRKYEGLFRKFAQSFRPLTDAERAEIQEVRLRTAHAQPGETLAALSKRTGNVWDLNYTAVVNGLMVGEALVPGESIKVAVREPYAPAPAPAPPTGRADLSAPRSAVGSPP
jgi:predicted Zn-dependent protease